MCIPLNPLKSSGAEVGLHFMDEPTNHMDIVGKEALEQMLNGFPGTVLFVSHDRYFISRVATGVLEFEKSGVKQYQGTYEEHLQEKGKLAGKNGMVSERDAIRTDRNQVTAAHPTLKDVFDKKAYYNPGKIRSRLTRQLEKYENQLAESEEKTAALKLKLMDPALAADYEALMDIQAQIDEEEKRQESLLERMLETETELLDFEE